MRPAMRVAPIACPPTTVSGPSGCHRWVRPLTGARGRATPGWGGVPRLVMATLALTAARSVLRQARHELQAA